VGVNVADTSLWVLVKVITNSDVPPALIVLGVKVLVTRGKLGVILSISATVQVPATHPVATLVLDTPAGAEMEAVLVIWVCAKEICGMATESKTPSISADAPNSLIAKTRQKITRLRTLVTQDKQTPNDIGYKL
jgi:hypothetical protein